jgi:hypothetical protein
MTLTTIASAIFALIKAAPKILELYNKVESLVLKWRVEQISNEYSMKRDKITAITLSISRAATNEERRALSKILHDYTSGKF